MKKFNLRDIAFYGFITLIIAVSAYDALFIDTTTDKETSSALSYEEQMASADQIIKAPYTLPAEQQIAQENPAVTAAPLEDSQEPKDTDYQTESDTVSAAYPPPSSYTYVGSNLISCTDENDTPISCQEVAMHVPMLSPEAVTNHYCAAGVCMERGACIKVIGADPLYADPGRYGIKDWGTYAQENYKDFSDPSVCY